jgi:hypothetical protein
MGGIWGLAASTALENLPVGLRGLASGVLQQGYAVGYLVGPSPFVALFWRSCGLAVLRSCSVRFGWWYRVSRDERTQSRTLVVSSSVWGWVEIPGMRVFALDIRMRLLLVFPHSPGASFVPLSIVTQRRGQSSRISCAVLVLSSSQELSIAASLSTPILSS